MLHPILRIIFSSKIFSFLSKYLLFCTYTKGRRPGPVHDINLKPPQLLLFVTQNLYTQTSKRGLGFRGGDVLQSTHGGREVFRRRGLARRHGACASATPREGGMGRDIINWIRPNVCYWRRGEVRRGSVCHPVTAARSGG